MGFWKKNSYQIVRLFVIQIGIAIFGMVLSFAVQTAFREKGDRIPLLFVSIFSVLFYLFILYSVGWEIGGQDRLKLDAVHAQVRGGKGFLLILYAEFLSFLLCILMLIGGIVYFAGASAIGSRFFAAGYVPANFFFSMFAGVIRVLLEATKLDQETSASYYLVAAILYLASTVPAIAVTGFAYWMGVTERRLIPSATRTSPGDKN